jgi:hypothetical protein
MRIAVSPEVGLNAGAVTCWHIDPFERMLNTAKNLLPRLQLSIASLQTSPQK